MSHLMFCDPLVFRSIRGSGGLESRVHGVAQMKRAIMDGVAEWRHGPLTDDMSLVLVELS